jgi:hypothetical protein
MGDERARGFRGVVGYTTIVVNYPLNGFSAIKNATMSVDPINTRVRVVPLLVLRLDSLPLEIQDTAISRLAHPLSRA